MSEVPLYPHGPLPTREEANLDGKWSHLRNTACTERNRGSAQRGGSETVKSDGAWLGLPLPVDGLSLPEKRLEAREDVPSSSSASSSLLSLEVLDGPLALR